MRSNEWAVVVADLREAYEAGPGSMGVAVLCFFSFLTGMGSCSAFNASLKACKELLRLSKARLSTND